MLTPRLASLEWALKDNVSDQYCRKVRRRAERTQAVSESS